MDIKKQPIVSLSSVKAEYVAATSAACQATWLKRILNNLAHVEKEPTPNFCGNSSAIVLSKNPAIMEFHQTKFL